MHKYVSLVRDILRLVIPGFRPEASITLRPRDWASTTSRFPNAGVLAWVSPLIQGSTHALGPFFLRLGLD